MQRQPVIDLRPLPEVFSPKNSLRVILVNKKTETRCAFKNVQATSIADLGVFHGRNHSMRVDEMEPGLFAGALQDVNVVGNTELLDGY